MAEAPAVASAGAGVLVALCYEPTPGVAGLRADDMYLDATANAIV